jgi:D-sedoheptulose 7-phosphate isomerase
MDKPSDNPGATSCFHQLAGIISKTEATDTTGRFILIDDAAQQATEMILSVQNRSGKVFLIGNGGSASIVGHMQTDLCNAGRVRAMVFFDTPMLTALSNDHGYGCVFEKPLKLWAEAGDLLIAVSSSGQSENILRGVKQSLAQNCGVITLSGFRSDNPLRRMGILNFYVPSQTYGPVESVHSLLTHFIADRVAGQQAKSGG